MADDGVSDAPIGRVLVVEDEAVIRDGLVRALRRAGLAASFAVNLADARSQLSAGAYDCVLLDLRLPDGDGLDFLAEVRSQGPDTVPVVVATAYDDSERVIRAMRLGAYDYVTKPFDLVKLRDVIDRAVRAHSLVARRGASAVAPPAPDGGLIGRGAAMREVWKAIGRAAAADVHVLVTGPTGSGKELIARAIHSHSARSQAPFVAVNLAGLPETLLESELFGHERGAFTGATQRRVGRVEAARGGTLFLDEIGDLSPSLQTKILRFLQERTYERVGSTETHVADVRLIAATLAPVKPGAEGVRLRPDLYYRLAVMEIEAPPLGASREDIPALVHHGAARAQARGISDEAVAELARREWPGNVRELLHVVERAAAFAGGEIIDVHHLPSPAPQRHGLADALIAEQLGAMTLREVIALVERTMVRVALEREKGNRSRAARLLGIGRPLLYAKMREHGLSVDAGRESADEPDPLGGDDE